MSIDLFDKLMMTAVVLIMALAAVALSTNSDRVRARIGDGVYLILFATVGLLLWRIWMGVE